MNLHEASKKAWEEFKEKRSNLSSEKLSFIPSIVKEGRQICVIDIEDVVHEASTWIRSIICVVLGPKPSQLVLEGFVPRVWSSFGVDKVLRLDNGHFVVKFNNELARDAIVDHGIWFFNKKPLIIRAWTGDNDALAGVNTVHVWVKFPRLSGRY